MTEAKTPNPFNDNNWAVILGPSGEEKIPSSGKAKISKINYFKYCILGQCSIFIKMVIRYFDFDGINFEELSCKYIFDKDNILVKKMISEFKKFIESKQPEDQTFNDVKHFNKIEKILKACKAVKDKELSEEHIDQYEEEKSQLLAEYESFDQLKSFVEHDDYQATYLESSQMTGLIELIGKETFTCL